MGIREALAKAILGNSSAKRSFFGGGFGFDMAGSIFQGTAEFLNAYADVGWLNAVIGKIAMGVAGAKWHLYKGEGKDRKEIKTNAILDVVRRVNPFYTEREHFELHQIYMELAGRCFWAVNRNPQGVPIEIWILPAHQVRVIPSAARFIDGYEYKSGSYTRRLRVEDVTYFRYPDPRNPWGGLSPFHSALTDIEAEYHAAKWNRNFFRNSARPDGVLETDSELTDDQYKKLKADWNERHQGTSKAHHVGILEGGLHYKASGFTQKEMDFDKLRGRNRENILGIPGMPLPVMGITENVNRANAEAGAYVFSKWLIKPRLDRIKDKINEQFIPQFPGSEGLYLDYDEIVEETLEQKRMVAEAGVKWGFITVNEGRALVGLDTITGGDTRLLPMGYTPIGEDGVPAPVLPEKPSTPPSEEPPLEGKTVSDRDYKEEYWRGYVARANGHEETVVSVMIRFWAAQEKEVITNLEVSATGVQPHYFDPVKSDRKLAKSILPAITDVYVESAVHALELIDTSKIAKAPPKKPEDVVDPNALQWLLDHAAELAKGINETTQAALMRELSEGYNLGESIPDLAKRVRNVFDQANSIRSKLIARTETIRAASEGALQTYSSSNVVDQVEFYCAIDERTCEECSVLHEQVRDLTNAGGEIPVHPNCRCTWLPIVKED